VSSFGSSRLYRGVHKGTTTADGDEPVTAGSSGGLVPAYPHVRTDRFAAELGSAESCLDESASQRGRRRRTCSPRRPKRRTSGGGDMARNDFPADRRTGALSPPAVGPLISTSRALIDELLQRRTDCGTASLPNHRMNDAAAGIWKCKRCAISRVSAVSEAFIAIGNGGKNQWSFTDLSSVGCCLRSEKCDKKP